MRRGLLYAAQDPQLYRWRPETHQGSYIPPSAAEEPVQPHRAPDDRLQRPRNVEADTPECLQNDGLSFFSSEAPRGALLGGKASTRRGWSSRPREPTRATGEEEPPGALDIPETAGRQRHTRTGHRYCPRIPRAHQQRHRLDKGPSVRRPPSPRAPRSRRGRRPRSRGATARALAIRQYQGGGHDPLATHVCRRLEPSRPTTRVLLTAYLSQAGVQY
ncbi:Hypothetical protein GLP15_3399 [Giardia lamblia P15]|uniref:Uncharacterized protein n=1 Tax=Giardia intestinalis (strain P15) TaxID=658858 RepID=E1EVZ5_GIAIA|nr:Hypothetical protein GLP15_3399 [Giardia lamblia P15]